jgi:hypothetical protein
MIVLVFHDLTSRRSPPKGQGSAAESGLESRLSPLRRCARPEYLEIARFLRLLGGARSAAQADEELFALLGCGTVS